MATWDDVRALASALLEVDEAERSSSGMAWRVGGKLFVWERPLRKADIAALGDDAPTGPVLAARVMDEGVKRALVADEPAVYFTTPHFDGYPAVLVRLDAIERAALEELVTEAWLARAPKRLVKEWENR
jgi:hypothetical protein